NDVNNSGNQKYSDVFLFDRQANSMTLVSHIPSSTTTTPNKYSATPIISADGAFIAFSSAATDLTSAMDTNNTWDLFQYDRADGTVQLLTHASGQTTASDGAPFLYDISADGRYVLFTSNGDDLLPTDQNSADDVFLADTATPTPAISGKVYFDTNKNGVNDGDPGLAGALVYYDANNNGTFDGGEKSVITKSDGVYALSVPGNGDFWIRVIPPTNYGPTQPTDNAREITISGGQDSLHNDFGEAQVAAIAVMKLNDVTLPP